MLETLASPVDNSLATNPAANCVGGRLDGEASCQSTILTISALRLPPRLRRLDALADREPFIHGRSDARPVRSCSGSSLACRGTPRGRSPWPKALSRRALPICPAVVLVSLLVIPTSTTAFTVSTLVTPGCHEQVTSEALRTVRLDVPNAAPLPLTANEQALVDDLEFTPDQDMRDLGGVTLLLSVRDNDLKGRSSDDLTNLAGVQGDPNNQEEHCLRNEGQNEPGGSEAAVNACRAFIRRRVVDALTGLGANGAPDLTKRTSLTVYLSLRGQIGASLPTYYVRIGQAMHALEDSFTHAYRTSDGMKVTVILNWIDQANGTLHESSNGPAMPMRSMPAMTPTLFERRGAHLRKRRRPPFFD